MNIHTLSWCAHAWCCLVCGSVQVFEQVGHGVSKHGKPQHHNDIVNDSIQDSLWRNLAGCVVTPIYVTSVVVPCSLSFSNSNFLHMQTDRQHHNAVVLLTLTPPTYLCHVRKQLAK